MLFIMEIKNEIKGFIYTADFMRMALESDLSQIIDIYNAAVETRFSTADTIQVTIDEKRDWFKKHTENRPLYVYEENEKVVAWISFQDFYGRPAYKQTVEVSIYIHSEFQGKGLGYKLLQECVVKALELKIQTLIGFVFSHNKASINLFKSVGFVKWGELPSIAIIDGNKYDLSIYGQHLAPVNDKDPAIP
jgi:L-amino acid N-acyltransferase YncA